MKRRQFLNHGLPLLLGGATLTAQSAPAADHPTDAQTVLTLTGAIDNTNRAKMDETGDQLMHKHGIRFERAFSLTLADLEKLPPVTINPTLEYDARHHLLKGPRLIDVVNLAGIGKRRPTSLKLHGIDGYSPEISFEKAQKYSFILATHLDGNTLPIGGFGPLFAICDADHIPELAQKPLAQRFVDCPWGLYCIEVL